MTRFLRLTLIAACLVTLFACATKPPTVAQGLEFYDAGEYSKAFETLNKLATEGNALAQQALGVMYQNGQGVTKSEHLALFWFRQAAANNNASAQYLLAALLEKNVGASGNLSEAIKWYRLAASNGHPSAQYQMGQMELKGLQGAAPDPLKASYWFGLAAAQGDPQAQLQFGLLLMQGRSGPADRVLGFMWIDIAQGLGDNSTIQTALKAAQALTPSELKSAKQMSSQCIKQNYQSCSGLTR